MPNKPNQLSIPTSLCGFVTQPAAGRVNANRAIMQDCDKCQRRPEMSLTTESSMASHRNPSRFHLGTRAIKPPACRNLQCSPDALVKRFAIAWRLTCIGNGHPPLGNRPFLISSSWFDAHGTNRCANQSLCRFASQIDFHSSPGTVIRARNGFSTLNPNQNK
jgi:hypothetical protein